MGNPYKAAFWMLLSFILVTVLGSGALLLAGRAFFGGGGERLKVERVTSPGGNTDAVLVQVAESGGALGGANDELYLVPAGEEDLSERSFVIDQQDGRNLELRWRGERLLEVRYPAAMIRGFRNHAYVEREGGEPYVVELRLVPPEDEFSLPERLLNGVPDEKTTLPEQRGEP